MHIQIISLGKQKFSLNFAKSQKGLEVMAEILGPAKKYWPGSHWSSSPMLGTLGSLVSLYLLPGNVDEAFRVSKVLVRLNSSGFLWKQAGEWCGWAILGEEQGVIITLFFLCGIV